MATRNPRGVAPTTTAPASVEPIEQPITGGSTLDVELDTEPSRLTIGQIEADNYARTHRDFRDPSRVTAEDLAAARQPSGGEQTEE